MTGSDLRAFVARSRAAVEASPPTTLAETRAHLLDPLLAVLGWDVRADAATDVEVAGTELEYVLSIRDVPAAFVAVEAFVDALEESRLAALRDLMGRTGVDRACYTNGRRIVLLAGTDEIDRFTVDLASLPDHERPLAAVSRPAVAAALDDPTRAQAARRLAIRRDELTASVVDELAAVAGAAHEPRFEAAAERLLDELVRELSESTESEGGADSPASSDGPARGRAETEGAPGASECRDAGSERASERPTRGVDAEPDRGSGTDGAGSGDATPAKSEDGEFVVRFFGERGSIGAVGHSTAEGALVHATEFLLERGLSGVELPWRPEDEVVLAAESLDGACRRLPNGWYLNTGGSREARAERIEALASRAGLRAMLTGDWGASEETRGSQ